MDIKSIMQIIYEAAYEVRLHLGPGYLESVYKAALLYELINRNLYAQREAAIPVYYKDILAGEFRADILVNNSVIIEVKAVREVAPQHEDQLVNYLTATGIDYGFLINYGGYDYRIIRKSRIYIPPKK